MIKEKITKTKNELYNINIQLWNDKQKQNYNNHKICFEEIEILNDYIISTFYN